MAKKTVLQPRVVRTCTVDADSVKIAETSMGHHIRHANDREATALSRIKHFIDSAERGNVHVGDWSNLFAVVAAGLEAAVQRETMTSAHGNLKFATEAVTTDDPD